MKIKTPGHRMVKQRSATFCSCGHYLGGLGSEDGYQPSNTRSRYSLHRMLIHNAQREQG